jgi:restriction system protein
VARRRTKREERAIGQLVLIVLCLAAAGYLAKNWDAIWKAIGRPFVWSAEFIACIIVLGAIFLLARPLVARLSERRALNTLSRKLEDVTEKHMVALVRRRRQLVQADAYGHTLMDAWTKELFHFMNTQIRPLLNEAEERAFEKHSAKVACAIETKVEERAGAATRDVTFSDRMKPSEYEHLCADLLREAGWSARVTTYSRDFGVDVIAEKPDQRIVVQCKLYSSPVGLKAVQEIAAGKVHEQANYAIVVSNQRFTTAAAQIAATNGVLLLHHDDLKRIDQLLGKPGCGRPVVARHTAWSTARTSG